MNTPMLTGIAAALLAALAWSLNFIVPFVIGDYSIFDIALFRFFVSGLIALLFLVSRWNAVRGLTPQDWRLAFLLGIVGYFVYFQALAAAALYAGPVIAPAFLALVPVVLAIAGNLLQPTIAWRYLVAPL